jgi:hypothetical protein
VSSSTNQFGTSTSTSAFISPTFNQTSLRVEVTIEPRLPQQVDSQEDLRQKALTEAVFGYIQAIRALGKTSVTASEIAKALELQSKDVLRALTDLRSRGVTPG